MFVLDTALKMIEQWQSLVQRPLQIAVNISPVQFNDQGLFQHIQQKLAKYQLTGHALEIEITEGVLLEGTKELKNTLNDIRKLILALHWMILVQAMLH